MHYTRNLVHSQKIIAQAFYSFPIVIDEVVKMFARLEILLDNFNHSIEFIFHFASFLAAITF